MYNLNVFGHYEHYLTANILIQLSMYIVNLCYLYKRFFLSCLLIVLEETARERY